jgi:hypothetical protein
MSIEQPKDAPKHVPIAIYIEAFLYRFVMQQKVAAKHVPIAIYGRLSIHDHSAA